MEPNEFQKLLEEAIIRVVEENGLTSEQSELVAQKFADVLPELSINIAESFYASLKARMPKMLKGRRRQMRSVMRRHNRLWRGGLDSLEGYLVATFEIGEGFNAYHRADAASKNDYLFEALTRLHARSVQIGYEVLALLSAGFADGAHARWRTAHEIAVIANFLKKHGNDVAERYLLHEHVESFKAMREFQEHADQLGHEKYSQAEVEVATRRVDGLRERFGAAYVKDCGWAASALGTSDPRLPAIEKDAGLSHLRPYYRMASHNVHAASKGITYRLGLSRQGEVLLAGPSNYGLTDPAHGVALSILQVTIPLINQRINMDSLVIGRVLTKFTDDVGAKFLEVQRMMES